jgi:hypothetical protein
VQADVIFSCFVRVLVEGPSLWDMQLFCFRFFFLQSIWGVGISLGEEWAFYCEELEPQKEFTPLMAGRVATTETMLKMELQKELLPLMATFWFRLMR